VSYWGVNSGEGDFVFHKGQLLAGCMDKAQFGKFGLVHAMQVRSSYLLHEMTAHPVSFQQQKVSGCCAAR
jgi:hypothetical protein